MDTIEHFVNSLKENMKDEVEIIKVRFSNNMPFYFKDLLQIIALMLDQYKGEKLKKKCK
jgi:hypothetical protein